MQRENKLPPLSQLARSVSGPPQNSERDRRPTLQQAATAPGLAKPRGSNTSGYLSTWPAHVTSQIVQQGQRQILSAEIMNHGCGEEYGGPIPKPRFLEFLESYLKRELRVLDPQCPKIQDCRLQAYREVFDYFIEGLKTYKPLLCAIKNEYEVTLECQREQIRDLEPLRAQLVLVAEQCERRILGLREQERAEIRKLKEEGQRLCRFIESMREKHCALETQVSQLQEDLATQYMMYREECDARKLLIANLSSVSFGPQKEGRHEEKEAGESEDPVKLRLALKVSREDLAKAQHELRCLQADYEDVVPRRDWENLDHSHRENLLKLETLQKTYEQMKMEYDTLLDVHREVSMQRDALQGELERHKGGFTPRPHWELCAEMLGHSGHWTELFEGQSSQKRLEILLEELQGKAAKDELFTGMGTSDDVPVYLRYDGQLSNLKLKKADVARVIKGIWKEKALEDEKRDVSSGLPEFLRRYLETHYGLKAGDWAYSLMESVQHHLNNDQISLFHDILTGKVDESVYHGECRLVSHLLKMFIQSDVTESGTLSISEFRETLRKAFPLKGDQDIEELVTAAQTELDTLEGSIAYQRLYREDTEGKQQYFLNLVRRQSFAERHQYSSQLRTHLGGRAVVDVESLRAAFEAIDPSCDSETLGWNLTVAFQIPAEQLHNHTAHLDTETALQRLSVADVCRKGPMP